MPWAMGGHVAKVAEEYLFNEDDVIDEMIFNVNTAESDTDEVADDDFDSDDDDDDLGA